MLGMRVRIFFFFFLLDEFLLDNFLCFEIEYGICWKLVS